MKTTLQEQAKALLLRYKMKREKGYYVISIQAQKKVELGKLKKLLRVKELKIAQLTQLIEVTECNFGELPPFGSIFGLQLIIDKDLLQEKLIYFNAGLLTKSIALDPKDLVKLENPILY
ncbi:MAG: hypothetical protein GPJ54_11710 [Candidatus Heimdallarchaeota archaeon]|nr:hypothetical protein [Candidatus Heimdallarchaeota archaeon]